MPTAGGPGHRRQHSAAAPGSSLAAPSLPAPAKLSLSGEPPGTGSRDRCRGQLYFRIKKKKKKVLLLWGHALFLASWGVLPHTSLLFKRTLFPMGDHKAPLGVNTLSGGEPESTADSGSQ